MPTIIPETLRAYREKRGLSQKKLAYKTEGPNQEKVSLSTIKVIEGKKSGHEARMGTIKSLADALEISPETLSQPFQDDVKPSKGDLIGRRPLMHEISGSTHLALDLVAARYKVLPSDLLEMAPLFAVLMFEGSLTDRKRVLSEISEAQANLSCYAKEPSGHLSFVRYTSDVDEGLYREEKSIREHDIFGRQLEADGSFNTDFDSDFSNPFFEYLLSFEKRLGDTGIKFDEFVSNFPSYELFDDFLSKFTGGSPRARFALMHGYTRIFDVPKRLHGEGQTGARTKWLEERVVDAVWLEHEEHLADLLSSL